MPPAFPAFSNARRVSALASPEQCTSKSVEQLLVSKFDLNLFSQQQQSSK
jgi:hypothetical protein